MRLEERGLQPLLRGHAARVHRRQQEVRVRLTLVALLAPRGTLSGGRVGRKFHRHQIELELVVRVASQWWLRHALEVREDVVELA